MKKKGQVAEADIASCVEDTKILMASYVEDNTSQGKIWIFNSGNTVHAYFQKELFNFLVAKEKGIVKMVDSLICEIISIGTVKVTKRDDQYVRRRSCMSKGMIQSNIHRDAR